MNINNQQNTILCKGNYDCEGGVEDLTVTKIEKFAPFGPLDYKSTKIFKGDIPKLSQNDDHAEIKASLKGRFEEEGFIFKFSIS